MDHPNPYDFPKQLPPAPAVRYFHGGPVGRQRGAFILPPCITGAKTLANYGNTACGRDRVYVTNDYRAALLYAAGWPKGVIYEVEPIGDLGHDPDCNTQGFSFECERARIVRIHKPAHHEIMAARKALVSA